MNLIETPTQIHNPAADFQNPMGPPVIDKNSNFADDPDTLVWIQQNVIPLMERTRGDRATLNEEWLEIQKMSYMQHGKSKRYEGMSDAYIPAYAKNANTRVSHTAAALFPSEDFLSARALTPDMEPMQEAAKKWMMYQMLKEAALRSNMKPFLRQLFDYGTSVGKVWYDTTPAKTKKGSKRKNAEAMLEAIFAPPKNAAGGCRFRAVSMFAWYSFPASVDNIAQATLVFEDIQVSKQFADQMVAAGEWKHPEVLVFNSNLNITDSARQDQMAMQGLSGVASREGLGELGQWMTMSEVYCRMPLPRNQYREDEQPGDLVPVQLIVLNNVAVVARRNPFWFQHAPYVVKSINERPDMMYGVGLGRQGSGLQGLINDFANQTNDNGMYALNPVAIINPNSIIGTPKMSPGAAWYATDPKNAVVFDRPPHEQVQMGMGMGSQMQALLSDLLGTPPILQGSGGGGNARTATGSQILQANTKTDIQDDVEDLEEEVLAPLMEMMWSLGQQYESAERMIAIAGAAIKIDPQMFAGDFAFQWLASTQTQNQQMKLQGAMQFMQALLNPATLQLLMQQGRMVNPEPILRRVYTEGLGFQNFDTVVTPPQMPMMPPGMPGAPPGMPGMPTMGPPGGPPPGADLSAIPGGQPGPGEGEAFGDVRGQANDISAMMGGMLGG